jgi:transposase
MLKVYGDNVMSRTRVSEWHKRFVEGREEVEDDERPGRPSTSKTEENVEKISETLRKDGRLSTRIIAEMLIRAESCEEKSCMTN